MFLPRDGLVSALAPVVDTAIYSSGDLLFAPVEIQFAALSTQGLSFLYSLLLSDASNQKTAMDLWIFDRDPGSLAAINAAVTLSVAQAAFLVGRVVIAAADWTTAQAATNAIAQVSPNQMLPTKKGSTSLWLAGVSRGTPTYATASALKIKAVLGRQ